MFAPGATGITSRTATVVVPTHLGGRRLERVLDSLAAQTAPVRTIVVDNAGPADIAEIVGRHEFAEHLRLEENVGFGRAINRAAALSRDDALVLVNDDCVCHPGFVEELVGALDPAGGVVMAAGVLVEAHDETTIDTAGVELDDTLLGFDYLNGAPPRVHRRRDPSSGRPLRRRCGLRPLGVRRGGRLRREPVRVPGGRRPHAAAASAPAAAARSRLEPSGRTSTRRRSAPARPRRTTSWAAGRGYLLRKWSVVDSPGRALRVLASDGVVCGGQIVLDRTRQASADASTASAPPPACRSEPYPDELLGAAPQSRRTLGRRLRRRLRHRSRPVAHS